MKYEMVTYEKEDGIAILTFNRPQTMNAHNYKMKVEEQAAAEEALKDDAVRVLIVTGAGRGFHAGDDVKEVFLEGDKDRLKADQIYSLLGRSDPDSWTAAVSPRYFYGFPKPTIAAVNGPAVGGGLSIALSCDFRVVSEEAKFGYFFPRRGLMGPIRGMITLIHLVGMSRALEMMLSAEMVDAAEAMKIGLASRLVSRDRLLDEAKHMARKLMVAAPLSQQAIKHCLYKALFEPGDLEDLGERVGAALHESEDHKEGSLAFAQKRDPVWKSR
ncbi:MAG: enoyl-CoA hydratase/isomerase family protein [Chloroflexi bacterium]|nr:enoyl-CoA hydratase/isomerase family protein [Chloroflexota bacterium]